MKRRPDIKANDNADSVDIWIQLCIIATSIPHRESSWLSITVKWDFVHDMYPSGRFHASKLKITAVGSLKHKEGGTRMYTTQERNRSIRANMLNQSIISLFRPKQLPLLLPPHLFATIDCS